MPLDGRPAVCFPLFFTATTNSSVVFPFCHLRVDEISSAKELVACSSFQGPKNQRLFGTRGGISLGVVFVGHLK